MIVRKRKRSAVFHALRERITYMKHSAQNHAAIKEAIANADLSDADAKLLRWMLKIEARHALPRLYGKRKLQYGRRR